jgi:hypothetical protein
VQRTALSLIRAIPGKCESVGEILCLRANKRSALDVQAYITPSQQSFQRVHPTNAPFSQQPQTASVRSAYDIRMPTVGYNNLQNLSDTTARWACVKKWGVRGKLSGHHVCLARLKERPFFFCTSILSGEEGSLSLTHLSLYVHQIMNAVSRPTHDPTEKGPRKITGRRNQKLPIRRPVTGRSCGISLVR